MKFAVLGDIHGNLEALQVAYRAALDHGAERIYHLGDLGGYAPFVNEVVDFLAARGVEGVQGNYDEAVANDREHCGCKYEDPLQAEMANSSFSWTKAHATEKTRDYLKALPFEITFEESGWEVRLFHAAPTVNNLYWYEERPEKFFRDMGRRAGGNLLIYGHTHKPYRRDLGDQIFINVGSVGKPKDGDPRACVTLVEIGPRGVQSDFLRRPYNVEKVADAIVENGLPAYFAGKLKEGT
jgi:putative phosphoesterase